MLTEIESYFFIMLLISSKADIMNAGY